MVSMAPGPDLEPSLPTEQAHSSFETQHAGMIGTPLEGTNPSGDSPLLTENAPSAPTVEPLPAGELEPVEVPPSQSLPAVKLETTEVPPSDLVPAGELEPIEVPPSESVPAGELEPVEAQPSQSVPAGELE